MISLVLLIDQILHFYGWVVIIAVVLSWLVNFEVINVRNQFAGAIVRMFYSLTEPVFRPIRRFMPDLGGIDISPIVVLFGIFFLRSLIWEYLLRGQV